MDNSTVADASSNIGSENVFLYESLAIGAGILVFGIFIGLIGYILHLKEKRQAKNENTAATPGVYVNDYASLRRMQRVGQLPSTERNIDITEDYAEINEMQMLDARTLNKRNVPNNETLRYNSMVHNGYPHDQTLLDKDGYLTSQEINSPRLSSVRNKENPDDYLILVDNSAANPHDRPKSHPSNKSYSTGNM